MSADSRSQTALASLHETYTDSEGELDSDPEETSRDKYLTPSKDSTPSSMDDKDKPPLSQLVSYATEDVGDDDMGGDNISSILDEISPRSQLVSYPGGDDMSDSDDSKSSSDPLEDSSESRTTVPDIPPLSPVSFHRSLLNLKKNEIQLPIDPKGRCSKSLQEKIGELYDKKKLGKDMNASIQKRKDFRNPSIYEKLIQFCNIDEQGTNYPPETYDPHCWGPESFYEELAKRQKEEMDKREKDKKDRTKVEFISGTVKKSDSVADPGKRKSKWDVGIAQMPASALKPAALITPSVLPVPTGTKPTVISAFGTISKKAKQ